MASQFGKVSIVMPVFNAEKYIEETLISVIEQGYDDFEVIIVDNCSTDSTPEIIAKWIDQDERFKTIRLETNSGGPAVPRNVGLSNASGDFIAMLDADDIWLDNKLLTQLELLNSQDLNFVCCQAHIINEGGQPSPPKMWARLKAKLGNKRLFIEGLLWTNPIVTSSVIFRRDLLGESRFDEDRLINGVDDYMMWLTLLNKPQARPSLMQEKLVNYRVFGSSLSHKDGKVKPWLVKDYAVNKFLLQTGQFNLYRTNMIKKSLRTLFRAVVG